MRIPQFLCALILGAVDRVAESRPPDQFIGGKVNTYLRRWWLNAWRFYTNESPHWWQRLLVVFPHAYLHHFLRSDDDRALHDHPWCNVSVLLRGEYTEHSIAAGGIHVRRIRRAGDVVFRRAKSAHRIELHAGRCTTLFLTGFRVRDWGFHCPQRGWVHWRRFGNPDDGGETVGAGCEG